MIDEVGESGRVDVPAGRRAHDQRNLRNDPGGVGVAAEDLAIEAERDHTFLDASAASLVETDQRAAGLERKVDDLDDLLAIDLAQAAPEYRHVLAEHTHRPALDRAEPGDNPVSVGSPLLHPERCRTMPGELVQLGERVRVEEQLDALPGRLLALGVLLLNGGSRPGMHRLLHPAVQISEFSGSGVDVRRWNRAIHAPDSSYLDRCSRVAPAWLSTAARDYRRSQRANRVPLCRPTM